jgi:dTDP-4-amino-4,6-dideoxygalactose transaminase
MIDLKRKNLAINGGDPVRKKYWIDNFTTGEEEKEAVIEVLDSGYLSLFEGSYAPDPPFSFWGGPYVQKLEKDWSSYYGIKYSISMNSATSGLYASIGALGIGFGDEVITSPYTMSACAAGILTYGAIPVFADVNMESGSLDPASIQLCITDRTKAILVVHQFGIPADMDRIMAIANKHNLKVIEDCAQAHGAKFNGKHVGTFGDIGVFSLNVNKTIQTGEGGICVTNNDDLHYRLALIRNHGEAVVGPAGVNDITNLIGYNYRMTEIQAAIGSVQLKKLEKYNEIRHEYVTYLIDKLLKYSFFIPLSPYYNGNQKNTVSTYYVFPFRYNPKVGGVSRNELISALNAEGIFLYQGYVRPLYLQPVYQKKQAFKFGYPFSAPENKECKMDYSMGICPNAEKLHFEELVINEHIRYPHTQSDIEDIINSIKKVLD